MSTTSVITKELVAFAREHFALAWQGIHGAPHWARVLRNGMLVGREYDADLTVIQYFAFIHDLARENDGLDPFHGPRGAKLAVQLYNEKLIDVTHEQLKLLTTAIHYHSDGYTKEDITICCCWDGDRLDLGRVGERPDPNRLCTEYAKRPDVIETCWQRSLDQAGF
jgi:uncharacterized protein